MYKLLTIITIMIIYGGDHRILYFVSVYRWYDTTSYIHIYGYKKMVVFDLDNTKYLTNSKLKKRFKMT